MQGLASISLLLDSIVYHEHTIAEVPPVTNLLVKNPGRGRRVYSGLQQPASATQGIASWMSLSAVQRCPCDVLSLFCSFHSWIAMAKPPYIGLSSTPSEVER